VKGATVLLAAVSVIALAAVSMFPQKAFLVWNRTPSAPMGLYIISGGALETGAWAVVSGKAASATWIAKRRYLRSGWPIIKRVAAVSGDEICRDGETVSINNIPVAKALNTDGDARELPRWQGCFTLGADEVFLLNDHPRSLDGRYFGATKRHEIIGVAHQIVRVE